MTYTGLHSDGQGKVLVFTWSGSEWALTAEFGSQWDTHMFGAFVDVDGSRLLVAADGSSPRPGGPGGLYLYTLTSSGWVPEVIAEDGEGFGFGASIYGDTIVAAAGHSDDGASLWVFARSTNGWDGTPPATRQQ